MSSEHGEIASNEISLISDVKNIFYMVLNVGISLDFVKQINGGFFVIRRRYICHVLVAPPLIPEALILPVSTSIVSSHSLSLEHAD